MFDRACGLGRYFGEKGKNLFTAFDGSRPCKDDGRKLIYSLIDKSNFPIYNITAVQGCTNLYLEDSTMISNDQIRTRARAILGNNIFSGEWLYALLIVLVVSAINTALSATGIGTLILCGILASASAA